MPGYYSRPSAGQLPLTPPDSGSGYGYSNMHYAQDPYQQQVTQCRNDSAYDYQQGYMQSAVAPTLPTYQYPQQNTYQPPANLPPISSYYEPIGAPILPPLRINDRVSFADDYQRRLQQEQHSAANIARQRPVVKEEMATGGVSAKLDYDMERMTDFVTDATASIFQYQMQNHPSFREWVHQVLKATRLPSATILLSLHYLNDRLANFPDSVIPGENQIYRLLAIALILGSKFLDDNTFINKSWSDVTSIKVSEINKLEIQWLELLEWHLHVDPTMPNGLQAWMESWKKYDADCSSKQQQALRLSPLDTSMHRHTPATGRDRFSQYPSPFTATSNSASSRTYEQPVSSRSSQFLTPYSATDPWTSSGRQAEDYYKRSRLDTYTSADSVNRSMSDYSHLGSLSHSNYYNQTGYASGWESGPWSSGHRYDCNCNACSYRQHYRPYGMTSAYAAQTVMG